MFSEFMVVLGAGLCDDFSCQIFCKLIDQHIIKNAFKFNHSLQQLLKMRVKKLMKTSGLTQLKFPVTLEDEGLLRGRDCHVLGG
jgi:hypothetical protein